jgi:hypothetical protein
MTAWPASLLGAALLFHPLAPLAADLPRLTPDAAYRELARSGSLARVRIDGDLDLARFRAPPGQKRVDLRGVSIEGALRSRGDGPPVAIAIDASTLHALDLRGAHSRADFALENSEIVGLAQFDDAHFGGAFSLHGSTLAGRASFRRARFDGPVAIVAARFAEPAGLRGGISFSDTQFAAQARFDRSQFASDVRFDSARFLGDATFLGLVVEGRASFRNVFFAHDAEFRFCRLGDVDFGDAEQMSVFAGLGDFRGCTMRSARFDYVDWRGDAMLVNVQVAPGDLSFRQAALRGSRSDLTGLKVAGRLDLEGAHITALHFRWPELAAPLARAAPTSDVLRPLHARLEELKQDEDAQEAWAALSDLQLRESLARPDVDLTEKLRMWLERAVWGWPTGYGTRLGRIALVSLATWLVLSLPLLLSRRLRIGRLSGSLDKAPPRHQPVPGRDLSNSPAEGWRLRLRRLVYSFGLMFAMPGFHLRPAEPVSHAMAAYLLALRGAGAVLLALLALTLTQVSPVFQAILGKIAG